MQAMKLNRTALVGAVAVLGLLSTTSCKSDDSSSSAYAVDDASPAPTVSFKLTGMT